MKEIMKEIMKVKDIFNGYDKDLMSVTHVCVDEYGFDNPMSIVDCIEQYGDREIFNWNLALTRVDDTIEPSIDIYFHPIEF